MKTARKGICRRFRAGVLSAAVCAAFAVWGELSLEEGFATPPRTAKPHTWYHMMNGNVTKAGITCDFEALARAGIGGEWRLTKRKW